MVEVLLDTSYENAFPVLEQNQLLSNLSWRNLPAGRVCPSARPFLHTGVDYSGPFEIKEGSRRSKKRIKIYVAVFVCFTTKAVHIEPVSSLTSEAFIATLHRFVLRRGVPSDIYSDNGTNFVRAQRELKCFCDHIKHEVDLTGLQTFLVSRGIN